MEKMFLIIFAIGWIINYLEARSYRKLLSRIKPRYHNLSLYVSEYEQTVQQQANIIEDLRDRTEHNERLLDIWRQRRNK